MNLALVAQRSVAFAYSKCFKTASGLAVHVMIGNQRTKDLLSSKVPYYV